MKALYFEGSVPRVALYMAASKFYRYAGITPFSPVTWGEVPEPEIPGDNWLKIKNRACGLCGTDMHFMFFNIDTKSFSAATPGIERKFIGHELLGTVTETGKNVTGFSPGDRVTMRIDWPSCYQLEIDPPCPRCAAGNYMLCQNPGKKSLPLQDTGGGFSPYMVMHKTQPFKIPDSVSDDEALLLEPLACAVHGLYKRIPAPGEKVLVTGCGTIGLMTIAAARALSPEADITAVDFLPHQLEMAKKMGASRVIRAGKDIYRELAPVTGAAYHRGHFGNEILLGGFDIVYDCVGSDRTITDAFRFVKGKGDVVIIGINFNPGKIDYSPIWNQEIRVTGMNCHANETSSQNSFDIALDLICRKKVDLSGIITHRFPMKDYKKAARLFLNKGKEKAIKIVLEHG